MAVATNELPDVATIGQLRGAARAMNWEVSNEVDRLGVLPL